MIRSRVGVNKSESNLRDQATRLEKTMGDVEVVISESVG